MVLRMGSCTDAYTPVERQVHAAHGVQRPLGNGHDAVHEAGVALLGLHHLRRARAAQTSLSKAGHEQGRFDRMQLMKLSMERRSMHLLVMEANLHTSRVALTGCS